MRQQAVALRTVRVLRDTAIDVRRFPTSVLLPAFKTVSTVLCRAIDESVCTA